MTPLILYKLTALRIIIFLFFVLLLIWFVGWKSIRYDDLDKEIGKKVTFTVPMIVVSDFPDNMTIEHIADEYDAILDSATSWDNLSPYFPEATANKIPCNEVLNVVSTFYSERHGLLTRSFGHDMQYYVLSSDNYKNMVIWGGDYERYTNGYLTMPHDCSIN